MGQTDELVEQWLKWRRRRGKGLGERSSYGYSRWLQKLAAAKGPLLQITHTDLQDYLDEVKLSDQSKRLANYAFESFFRFAVAEGRLTTDPTVGLRVPPDRRKETRSRARLWAGMPRRELLPREYRPLFDFLRDTLGRHPELTADDLRSIRVPGGRVPDIVELHSKKRDGQMLPLSPRARIGLAQMGGSISGQSWRTVERVFRDAYKGEFPPMALKDMPPIGFGIDMHPAFEGNIREQLTNGQMEDAARAAFVELEDRIRRLVRQMTGKEIRPIQDLVNLLFGDSGPLSKSLPSTQREPLRMLILGAFGVLRNLVGHRTDIFPSESHGIDVILVADLAMRLLDPIEDRLHT